MKVLGIDIGGSGIKGAPVETATGRLLADRYRLATPRPATPSAVAGTVARVVGHFGWKGPVGCTLPGVVQDGVVRTAANISGRWKGVDARELLGHACGAAVTVINDADAAGYAEMTFGAGRGREGVVIVVTLGTGIGSALFTNGHLVPNTELGHLMLKGRDAETWAAESVRKRKGLTWKQWAQRVDAYLNLVHGYFWPDLLVVGGGVSRKWEKFLPRLTVATEVVPAALRNDAGIVGAALAYEHERRRARQKRSLGTARARR